MNGGQQCCRLRPSRIAMWMKEPQHRGYKPQHHKSSYVDLPPEGGASFGQTTFPKNPNRDLNVVGSLHEAGWEAAGLPPFGLERGLCSSRCPAQSHHETSLDKISRTSPLQIPTLQKVGQNRRGRRSLQALLDRRESNRGRRGGENARVPSTNTKVARSISGGPRDRLALRYPKPIYYNRR